MRKIIFLLAVILAVTAAVAAQINLGNQAPQLALKDLKGKTVRLSRYKGKIILLNFWATWCPPCRTEIPELIKWQKEYQDQGLQIIGVTYPPGKVSTVRTFVRENRINYPILIGARKTKVLFELGETLPLTVVIDHTGNVKEIVEGILFPEEFDEKIKPLLQLRRKEIENQQKSVSFLKILR